MCRIFFKACRCCLLFLCRDLVSGFLSAPLWQCHFLMLLLFFVPSPTLAGPKVKSCQADCFSAYLRQAICQNINWRKKCHLFFLSEERMYFYICFCNEVISNLSTHHCSFDNEFLALNFQKGLQRWLAKPEQEYPGLPCFFLERIASLVT